jgi:hypothetical protein
MTRVSPIIRFRVDREIVKRAHQMAKAQGMELPDVLRRMLTKAVLNRSFSIYAADHEKPEEERARPDPFEPRYWGAFKNVLETELAIALLRRAIADASAAASEAAGAAAIANVIAVANADASAATKGDEARSSGLEPAAKKLGQEREKLLRLLADYDVSDANATEGILKRDADIGASGRPSPGAGNSSTSTSTSTSPGATRRRTRAERDRFVSQCCIPDLIADAAPSSQPAAMVVLGQPGAGASGAAALQGREMCRSTGPAVALSMERIRAYGSGLDPARAQRRLGRALDAVRERRLHLILEDELDDPPRTHHFINRLRQDGYAVQLVVVCVSSPISRLLLAARYALWRQHRLEPEFVSAARHDLALADLRATLDDFEGNGKVDSVKIITRAGRQLFENRMEGGDWLRTPRAVAVLDKEQSRAIPDKDAVQLAMCWETLSRALVHDRAVPRDVASQVLEWRGHAVAQCEAIGACARSLQWAYEGAAFREMDRFAFEAAFPHHARATALMGEAVIEAEAQEAAEAERFLRSARENIAQRIERGDMARIQARTARPAKDRPQA